MKSPFRQPKLKASPFIMKQANALSETGNIVSRFVKDQRHVKVDPAKIHWDNEKQILQNDRDKSDKMGSGSVFVDMAAMLGKKITPSSWGQKYEDGVYAIKKKMESLDTSVGSFLAGKNPNSTRASIFSTQNGGTRIGKLETEDGNFVPIHVGVDTDRRPSALAPIGHTVKFTTPLLATLFVSEKLRGPEPTPPLGQVSSPYPEMAQTASIKAAEKMEKEAELYKIAELKDQLEKMASENESLREERDMLQADLSLEKQAHEYTKEAFEKKESAWLQRQAELETFYVQAKAEKREKLAGEVTAKLLQYGMIKQAQYREHLDLLSVCPEDQFSLYENMAKQAENLGAPPDAEMYTLESDSHDSSFPKMAGLLVSRRGETMGEAATNLLEKMSK